MGACKPLYGKNAKFYEKKAEKLTKKIAKLTEKKAACELALKQVNECREVEKSNGKSAE